MREKPLKWRALAVLGRLVKASLWLAFQPFGKRRQTIALSTIIEQISHVHETNLPTGKSLKFFCPGYKPGIRGITILSKQPEVPRWIDDFEEGDVLWDIGANVGVYSLYAALMPGVQVLAFEPEASNYYVLTRNVALNKMWDRIKTYCIALSDETSLGELSLFHTVIGGSKHAFGDPAESWVEDDPIAFQQGMIGFSIDDMIDRFACPFPNHIKIDVDGIEDKIIAGAAATLKDSRLKSLLVEIQAHKPAAGEAMKAMLVAAGFQLVLDAGANLIYRRDERALPESDKTVG
jgi:FkbM family methyltransferase